MTKKRESKCVRVCDNFSNFQLSISKLVYLYKNLCLVRANGYRGKCQNQNDCMENNQGEKYSTSSRISLVTLTTNSIYLCISTYYLPAFRNFLFRDMKCGMICLSHAAQLPVLNGRKCSPKFHSTFPILVITKIFGFIKVI